MWQGSYKAWRVWAGAWLTAMLPLFTVAEPLVCDQASFPFGTVDAATGIVVHVFDLRNEGRQPLVIDEVAAPCGCIALKIQTNLLAAGFGTHLPVTLDLRRRSGEQRLAAHVRYHTQGAEDEDILTLSMLGTVVGTNTAVAVGEPARATAVTTAAALSIAGGHRVVIELFGEAGCEACATVRREVLPAARALLGDRGVIIEHDVYETTNYMMLANYQDRLHVLTDRRNDPVSIVVDGCRYLGGVEEIRRELPGVLRERLREGSATNVVVAVADRHALDSRFEKFTLPLIIAAGFLDGISHCAIATVVFLVSLLSVSKVRGRDYLRLGIPFCVASFLTYFFIGMGLLKGMQSLSTFAVLRTVLNGVIACCAVVFAYLSFRDAWRFRRSGDAKDVALQLPLAVKKTIHAVMRRGIGGGSLIVGGLMVGLLVTALEGICTGQVYVPTLAMIARTQEHSGRALRYLLAYNIASDVPLIAVLVLGYVGVRTEALLTLSRRNVVLSKILAGIFFTTLAVLIVAL